MSPASRVPDLTEPVTGFRGFKLYEHGLTSPYRPEVMWNREHLDDNGWMTATCIRGRVPPPQVHMNTAASHLEAAVWKLRLGRSMLGIGPRGPRSYYQLSPQAVREMPDTDIHVHIPNTHMSFIGNRMVEDGGILGGPELTDATDLGRRAVAHAEQALRAAESIQAHAETPSADCSCGLYALHSYLPVSFAAASDVIALVEAKGVIHVHHTGIRAEKMRMIAIAPNVHGYLGKRLPTRRLRKVARDLPNQPEVLTDINDLVKLSDCLGRYIPLNMRPEGLE